MTESFNSGVYQGACELALENGLRTVAKIFVAQGIMKQSVELVALGCRR